MEMRMRFVTIPFHIKITIVGSTSFSSSSEAEIPERYSDDQHGSGNDNMLPDQRKDSPRCAYVEH
jgi:hypothetical protein